MKDGQKELWNVNTDKMPIEAEDVHLRAGQVTFKLNWLNVAQ